LTIKWAIIKYSRLFRTDPDFTNPDFKVELYSRKAVILHYSIIRCLSPAIAEQKISQVNPTKNNSSSVEKKVRLNNQNFWRKNGWEKKIKKRIIHSLRTWGLSLFYKYFYWSQNVILSLLSMTFHCFTFIVQGKLNI